jgi:hypothetical protein
MKTRNNQRSGGFGLMDAVFAMAAAGVLFAALYGGLAFGFNTIKFARENTRATQIMVEKMETIRLYTWSQINSNGFVPTNKFVVPYYSIGGTNSSVLYTGRVTIASAGLGTTYSDNMRKVTINLAWVTGKTPRTRSMSTYVSSKGIYEYVYY